MQAKGSRRVAFIFLTVFSGEGGIQSYVKDVLSAYLDQEKLPAADIYILRDKLTDENLLREASKFTFYCLGDSPPSIGRIKLGVLLLWKLITQQYTKIICGHILVTPLVGPLSQLFQVPYTVMTYGKEVWETVPPRQHQGLKQAEDIWTISRYSRDLACAANELPPNKFRMLPPVVNGQLFTPDEKNNELVARYQLQDSRVLMTVARLWPGDIYKGVDVTIRALPEIIKVFPEVKYLVVGRGDDQPRLAKLAVDLGVGDRVVFAGFVPNDALVDHYRLADAYVMPSKEGFGIVYLEAMACGVPTLSGNDDGSADPLQDGRVGWRVPYRDSQAVAQACIEILRGEDPRCQGDWLRQATLEKFSSESLQATLGQLLAPVT